MKRAEIVRYNLNAWLAKELGHRKFRRVLCSDAIVFPIHSSPPYICTRCGKTLDVRIANIRSGNRYYAKRHFRNMEEAQ